MGGLPGAGEMGRQADGLLEAPQGLLPLAGIGGLDPGSLVQPGMRAAGVLMWDLAGAEAEGCQLGVQGLKGAAGPVVVGAVAVGVPGAGAPGQAVEGHPGVGVVAELEALQAVGRSGGPRAGPLGMESGCASPCQGRHPSAAAGAGPEPSC